MKRDFGTKATKLRKDAEGMVIAKCSFKSCEIEGNREVMVVHHRYRPFRCTKRGIPYVVREVSAGQYVSYQDALENLDNAEILCEKHHKLLEHSTDTLWEQLNDKTQISNFLPETLFEFEKEKQKAIKKYGKFWCANLKIPEELKEQYHEAKKILESYESEDSEGEQLANWIPKTP